MSNMIASAHKSVYHARWVVEILGFDELGIIHQRGCIIHLTFMKHIFLLSDTLAFVQSIATTRLKEADCIHCSWCDATMVGHT